jgi:TolB protein
VHRNKSLLLMSICALVVVCTASGWVRAQAVPSANNVFDGHGDMGTVLHPGSVEFDPSQQTYVVTGSGENMWFATDVFHFSWKKVSGDVSLTADVAFTDKKGNEHKKAVLMFRQSLDPNSAYVDVALHASGLTSLQYREEQGANTHEVQSNISAPARLRIVKRGDYVSLWLAGADANSR